MNQDKKTLSEPEVCDRFITPAIRHAGWSLEQIRREYQLTDGQVMVGGQTATRNKTSIRRANYILMYQPDLPLAVIEAKRNKFSVSHGIQQAKAYSQMADIINDSRHLPLYSKSE